MIYFMNMLGHEDSPIKPGFTDDVYPYRRRNMLQTGNPYRLDIVARAPGGLEIERAIHRKFGEYRCDGGRDWFYAHAELLELVEIVKMEGKIPLHFYKRYL